MEKRIGAALILVKSRDHIPQLNDVISRHYAIIIGRQGIPLSDRGLNIISLALSGTTDEIGALTGQIGRLDGIQVKSILLKKED